jgi:manganese transport protein
VRPRLRIGPGIVITAAFIGPGTVTTATLAGAGFGTALLWCLAFATVATIVLQEMSARLGLTTRAGLGQALRHMPGPRWVGMGAALLAVSAVVSGAAAYEAGNLTGAGLGLGATVGVHPKVLAAAGAGIAAVLLWSGRYRLVERVLVVCVAVMGLTFLLTAVLVLPRVDGILAGLFLPRLPKGAELMALGLVGTTIVPYNLFLHAAVVAERWEGAADLRAARLDLVLAIGLGGIVSAAVVVTAAAALGSQEIRSASDMAGQLQPLLGPWASRAFSLGFAAAGLSSAITAPLAAGYALQDVRGGGRDVTRPAARAVIMTTLLVGAVVALLGTRPVALILVAQVLNALILPIVAAVLLLAMNDRTRLGAHVNGWRANLIAGGVVLLCLALGVRGVWSALVR